MSSRTRKGVAVAAGVVVLVVATSVVVSTTRPARSGGAPPRSVSTTPSTPPSPTLHPDPQAPNILLVVTDDQRQGLAVMPNTRRIFRDGSRFTDAFVSDPLCCPSRASIFTGLYPHNHGVLLEEQATNLVQGFTIQHYLQEAGYETGIFGKYLNSWPIDRPPPYFDRWAIFRRSNRGYRNGIWNVNGRVKKIAAYSTGYIAHRAAGFLRARASDRRPWFLYLAPAAPHFPYTPAERYAHAPVPRWNGDPGTRERNRADKPPFVQTRKPTHLTKGKSLRRRQFRTLMSVDDMMGKLFHKLKRDHAARNTLIVFTSDNGFLWGEHGIGGKDLPYTEAIRVPLLARWPGHVPAGKIDRRLVSNVDVAPTILDALGLDSAPVHPMDGRSWLQGAPSRREVLTEYFHDGNIAPNIPSWASLRGYGYQYTEYYEGRHIEFREYYNLKRDPGELHNVISGGRHASAAVIERAHQLLQKARACSGTSCP